MNTSYGEVGDCGAVCFSFSNFVEGLSSLSAELFSMSLLLELGAENMDMISERPDSFVGVDTFEASRGRTMGWRLRESLKLGLMEASSTRTRLS